MLTRKPQNPESRLSLEKIEAAAHCIDPVFLNTPQFRSEILSNEFGMDLVLKVETANPIRSFKGRGADFYVSCLPAETLKLVCASAGNFGQGLSYAARKRGYAVFVFAPESANPLKLELMGRLGATVELVGRDYDAAKERAQTFAEERGALFVEDGREPAIAEGAGTIAIELCGKQSAFDFVVVPLGGGALLGGIGRWIKAHSPSTQVIGVCASGAPAMAMSWRHRQVQSTESAVTIADGIAIRVPVPEALAEIEQVADDVVLVTDDDILDAMRLAFRHHGLVVEPAGCAGLAAAIAHRERFQGGRVATPLCGGNASSEQVRRWLLGSMSIS